MILKKPDLKLIMKWVKKWVFPLTILILSFIVISWIVTNNHKRNKKVIERMTNPSNTIGHSTTEKVKLLLPHLKTYLLSKYPTRKSLTSDDDKKYDSVWEDLSGNMNDFKWEKNFWDSFKGFHTLNNTLTGPSPKELLFDKTDEFTIMIKVNVLENKSIPTEFILPVQPVNPIVKIEPEITTTSIGEIITNADLSNKGKIDLMTINIAAPIKEDFEDLKNQLNSNEQDQENSKIILVTAGQIKTMLDRQPNQGKRSPRNKTVFVLYGDGGDGSDGSDGSVITHALEVKIPNKQGSLEVYVNGKQTKNIVKTKYLDNVYYTIVYKRGHITAYVNNTIVIDEDVNKIKLSDNKVVFNPNGNLNVGLENVAFFNRDLNNKEIRYFQNASDSGTVVRTILDDPSRLFPPSGFKTKSVKAKLVPSKHSKHSNSRRNPIPSNPIYNRCPLVERNQGNYNVNGLSYGNNRRVAREIYRINFPKCQNIPNILDDWYNKERPLPKDSPFIVDSPFNPVKYYACENVDWSQPDPKMNNKCKRRVDAYCEEHAYLDPMCKPWRSEYRDLPEFRQFRNKFDDPRDKGYEAGDFGIEEHPDYSKYIRKDKIPCMGCTLE